MIVVPVFITNCHVSEKLNNGPLISQTTTVLAAIRKAVGLPVAFVSLVENVSNFFLNAFFSGFFFIFVQGEALCTS